MNWFVVVGGILLLAIVAALLLPLLKREARTSPEAAAARDLNLTVLREQLVELERDRREGRLSDEAYAQAKHELERRTLDDAGAEELVEQVQKSLEVYQP